jgi:(p)ppGpp synthase/HD superfamily hydrolase
VSVMRARQIAVAAHTGQVDKAGADYITHPERVAARVGDDESAQAVAWLHDVVEDTAVSLDDLVVAGMGEQVVAAVAALTHRPGESAESYYARVQADPLALQVKLADLSDNSDPTRLALLDETTRERLEAKYARARQLLGRRA